MSILNQFRNYSELLITQFLLIDSNSRSRSTSNCTILPKKENLTASLTELPNSDDDDESDDHYLDNSIFSKRSKNLSTSNRSKSRRLSSSSRSNLKKSLKKALAFDSANLQNSDMPDVRKIKDDYVKIHLLGKNGIANIILELVKFEFSYLNNLNKIIDLVDQFDRETLNFDFCEFSESLRSLKIYQQQLCDQFLKIFHVKSESKLKLSKVVGTLKNCQGLLDFTSCFSSPETYFQCCKCFYEFNLYRCTRGSKLNTKIIANKSEFTKFCEKIRDLKIGLNTFSDLMNYPILTRTKVPIIIESYIKSLTKIKDNFLNRKFSEYLDIVTGGNQTLDDFFTQHNRVFKIKTGEFTGKKAFIPSKIGIYSHLEKFKEVLTKIKSINHLNDKIQLDVSDYNNTLLYYKKYQKLSEFVTKYNLKFGLCRSYSQLRCRFDDNSDDPAENSSWEKFDHKMKNYHCFIFDKGIILIKSRNQLSKRSSVLENNFDFGREIVVFRFQDYLMVEGDGPNFLNTVQENIRFCYKKSEIQRKQRAPTVSSESHLRRSFPRTRTHRNIKKLHMNSKSMGNSFDLFSLVSVAKYLIIDLNQEVKNN